VSQRNSGYLRQEADNYSTPAWCTRALLPHIPKRIKTVWEPAAGEGAMANVLRDHGLVTIATDLRPGNGMPTAKGPVDFLAENSVFHAPGIITNPPFYLAQEFIERALKLTHREQGFVAMLLRADYDHAKGRRHLFADCPAFAKRLVLTRRIVWFVDPLTGKPKAAPSTNHSWYLWDYQHRGAPEVAYYLEEQNARKVDRLGIQTGEGSGRQDEGGPG
jgi:hypothetical protein